MMILFVSSLRGNTRRHVTCLCEYVSMTTANECGVLDFGVSDSHHHSCMNCIALEQISSSIIINWNMRCLFENCYTHSFWDMVKPLQYMTVHMIICVSICIPCDFGLTIRR